MPSGGSVGDGYGPMIVATQGFSQSEVKHKKIAIPGTLTTAYLALRLFAPGIETEVVPFDQIIPQVVEGKYEAGLIIHEGQLTYSKAGLQRIVDLGKWWLKITGLPLPLGGNAIRRSLGPELTAKVSGACGTAFSMPSTIAMRHWPTPCNSPATLIPSSRTNLWACT